MDKLLHSIDIFLTPFYLLVSFVDTLLNVSEKIVEKMVTNCLAGVVVQRGAGMKWKLAPGMQIPAAIWVTCPKGIIIPHMLSHAAGQGDCCFGLGSQLVCSTLFSLKVPTCEIL